MTKNLRLLSLLLLIQVAAAGAIWWQQYSRQQAAATPAAMITADLAQADQLLIEGDGITLTLKRDGERWRLPDYGNLYANDVRIVELRDKLTQAKSGWPVATSAAAASRFEVASDKFQRRITYKQGDQVLASAFLGTAPTFRKIHLRLEGSDAIHAVDLTLDDAPVNAKIWFDKTVQQLKAPVKALTAGSVALMKAGEQWQFGDGSPADNEAAERFIKRFADLYVTDWLDDEAAKPLLAKPPHYKASLTTDSGDVQYAFYRDGANTYVKSSLHPALFAMATFVAEPIWNTSVDSLKPKPAADAGPQPETAEGTIPAEDAAATSGSDAEGEASSDSSMPSVEEVSSGDSPAQVDALDSVNSAGELPAALEADEVEPVNTQPVDPPAGATRR